MRRLAHGALLALALALPIALGASEIVVARTGHGVWRGIVDPPGTARIAIAAAVGTALAVALRERATLTRPLLALLVAALPLLPLVTGRGLWLLLFQGPTLLIVAFAALGVALARTRSATALPAAAPAAVFALALLFSAVLTTRLPGAAGPQGDEPHYLVMAESLRSDGDLDLRDEHDGRAYRRFYPGRLVPHRSPASPRGALYSVHAPGLPLLILPAYALGGFRGAQLLMAALAALATALVFRLAREATRDEWTARATAASFLLLPPLAFYAVSLYPEGVAAGAVAVFLWTARRDPSPGLVLAAAVTAAALPWFHPKFLPLAALGLGLTLVRRGPWAARATALALGFAGLAGLLALFDALYGQASLSAAYGAGFASDVSLARVPRGLLALLLDRQFGLLPVAPLWALAVPGACLSWRRSPGDVMRAGLLAAATLVVGGSFSMWWGGTCPPARFVVPALPALAVMMAPAIARWPRAWGGLFGAGVAVTVIAAAAPRAIHNRPDGESALLKVLAPAVSLDALWPSFVPDAGPNEVGVHERRSTLELLRAWGSRRIVGVSGPLALTDLSLPLALPGAPWQLAVDETRFSRKLDLPPGVYRFTARARVPANAGAALRWRLAADAGSVGEGLVSAGAPAVDLVLTLPEGASRLVLTASGLTQGAILDDARLQPLALVRRAQEP